MTIDEVITQEREKAKQQKSKYDKCPTRMKYDCKMCLHEPKCNEDAKEHEQLAEWLEVLKAYRTLDKTNFSDGYNRGVDEAKKEAAKAICVGCGYLEGTKCTYTGCNCRVSKPMLEAVMKALEQLKAGGTE